MDLQESSTYKYAIRLLAPRDYSRHKLKEKLLSREFELDQIEEVLDLLEEKQYLDERRYAKGKIKAYIFRNKGPRYIEQKLSLEKIGNFQTYLAEVEEENEICWLSIAQEIADKFSKGKKLDYKERGKLWGKLMSRGFSSEIINQVLQ